MKKIVKSLLIVLLFLAVGEAVIRFDQATLFFQGARFQKLENEPMRSELLRELDAGSFRPEPDQLRVMVLGDSFLYQGKWPADVAFAPVLQDRLQAGPLGRDRRVLVLDLFVPGAGPSESHDRYFEYADRFRPDVVFWAYNRNDVMQVKPLNRTADKAPVAAASPATAALGRRDRLNAALYRFKGGLTHQLKVVAYLNRNLTQQLKAHGIVLPGSRFGFIIHRSADPGYPPWRRTQEIIAEVERDCAARGSELVVMVTPLLDILPYYDLVDPMDLSLQRAFAGMGTRFLNGVEPFRADPRGQYSISRYDEHPNGESLVILAEFVAARLVELESGSADPDAGAAASR